MLPETGSIIAFIISVGGKAFPQELVGQYTCLGETPDRVTHLKVNMSIVYLVVELVMFINPGGGKGNRNSYILISVERSGRGNF